MDKSSLRSRWLLGAVFSITLLLAGHEFLSSGVAQTTQSATPEESNLLEGFRHTEVASVSDAIEQLVGKKMYMSHRMQAIFTSKIVG